MLTKNSELRHRADQHKKETAHQECKFGVKRQQSVLRLGHLGNWQSQSQAGINAGKVGESAKAQRRDQPVGAERFHPRIQDKNNREQ